LDLDSDLDLLYTAGKVTAGLVETNINPVYQIYH